jgi:hypothetical protein
MRLPSLVRAALGLTTLGMLITLPACSTRTRPESTLRPAAALLVENRSMHDVVVYLTDGHVPFRLGRVSALERTRLPLPLHAVTTGVRVAVRSMDSEQVFSAEPVRPEVGGTLVLTVQPLFAQSTLSVLAFEEM